MNTKIFNIVESYLKKSTGEMSKEDIEKGGDWYEVRKDLEKLCKDAGVDCEVKPFDQYQGPYAMTSLGNIWIGKPDHFILDTKKETLELNKKDMIKVLKMFK